MEKEKRGGKRGTKGKRRTENRVEQRGDKEVIFWHLE